MCVFSVVVVQLNKISKGDKSNTVIVGLCQAWLLALLSHLVLRVVGTMGREVWGEEFDLPPLDLVDETEVDKVETEAIREIEQRTC